MQTLRGSGVQTLRGSGVHTLRCIGVQTLRARGRAMLGFEASRTIQAKLVTRPLIEDRKQIVILRRALKRTLQTYLYDLGWFALILLNILPLSDKTPDLTQPPLAC